MNQDKMHIVNKLFNNETIRTVWDNEKETVENLTIEKITDIMSKISMKEMAILVAKPKTHEKQESSLK